MSFVSNIRPLRTVGVAGFLLAVGTVCASATTVTISAVTPGSGTCAAGQTGTLVTDASGGINVNVMSGGSTTCFVGADGTFGNANDTTFIGGLNTEGTAAGLNALAQGWYAENGMICNGTSGGSPLCVQANSSTDGTNSGDVDVLINRTGSSVVFTTYNTGGTANTTSNGPGPSSCSVGTGGGTGITVAANTICFLDRDRKSVV